MIQRLRVTDGLRLIQAFALPVDLGDNRCLLMEIGALGAPTLAWFAASRRG